MRRILEDRQKNEKARYMPPRSAKSGTFHLSRSDCPPGEVTPVHLVRQLYAGHEGRRVKRAAAGAARSGAEFSSAGGGAGIRPAGAGVDPGEPGARWAQFGREGCSPWTSRPGSCAWVGEATIATAGQSQWAGGQRSSRGAVLGLVLGVSASEPLGAGGRCSTPSGPGPSFSHAEPGRRGPPRASCAPGPDPGLGALLVVAFFGLGPIPGTGLARAVQLPQA